MSGQPEMHCTACSWEGAKSEGTEYAGYGIACPVCGSDIQVYAEWLTDQAQDLGRH